MFPFADSFEKNSSKGWDREIGPAKVLDKNLGA